MRNILIVFCLLFLLVGSANAATAPHWQGTVEVTEMSETTVTIEVFSAYTNSDDNVHITKTQGLSDIVSIEETSFTLNPGESKQIELVINADEIPSGNEFSGSIIVTHSTETENTGVNPRESVPMNIRVVSAEGLIPGGDAGSALTNISTFLFVGITLMLATGVIRWRSKGKKGEFQWLN